MLSYKGEHLAATTQEVHYVLISMCFEAPALSRNRPQRLKSLKYFDKW